ncbi:MAG TPA: MlaD family protein [Polyangiaceae bacterium]|nr:MlaD family protein [Polyangiaceae bacterium]
MATRANYAKIGFFVILGFAAATTIAIAAGALTMRKKTIAYFTYFNEAVTGLDVGAPVKARGVKIGQVADIMFAPDRRMIEVRMEMDQTELRRLGFYPHYTIPSDLRAQLASQGLTGSRFISIDFFDPSANPVPAMNFTPPEHYVPAAKSQMKSLEDSVTKAMDDLANLVDTMSRQGFSEKTVRAMTSANDLLTGLQDFLKGVDRQKIPQRTRATIDEVHIVANKVSSVLDRVDGEMGLIATTNRSMSSIGDIGRNATGATRDLDQTLGEIREAAGAIRLLAEELEREPDVLLKGRTRGP